MTRKLTANFYANKREQNRIESGILTAIPAGAHYYNIIIVLAKLLQSFTQEAFTSEVWTGAPTEPQEDAPPV
jgi:hypothetical protein